MSKSTPAADNALLNQERSESKESISNANMPPTVSLILNGQDGSAFNWLIFFRSFVYLVDKDRSEYDKLENSVMSKAFSLIPWLIISIMGSRSLFQDS